MIGALLAAPMVVAQEDVGMELDLGTILLYILIGLVVGAIARLIVPGTGGMGVIATIIVGALGALIGGWVAGAIFEDTAGIDWIASILVAALLVWVFVAMSRRRTAV